MRQETLSLLRRHCLWSVASLEGEEEATSFLSRPLVPKTIFHNQFSNVCDARK